MPEFSAWRKKTSPDTQHVKIDCGIDDQYHGFMTISDVAGSPAQVTDTEPASSPTKARVPSTRHYAMTAPTHFAVEYAINPWMDTSTPVDIDRALTQWEELRRTYLRLGHTVDVVDAVPGLPDMVYAANGG